jgi:serine/threonine-protein kinase
MTPSSADVKSLFIKALELPTAADRAAFLDEACAGDAARRAEVEELLKALESAGSFLNRPDAAPGVTAAHPSHPPAEETADYPGEVPGTLLAGRYKLLAAGRAAEAE